ncbi:hypothetical protein CRV24_010452 [Beauveria bassiana]|nr:hypothetical protein CRV24_010452 [Beauveria bassiana]KAH8713597.1 hypothetical protein HC256_006725 [Beauveria bassiana]
MRFAHFTTFVLALATGTHAAASARVLADDINKITELSRQTNDIAMKITGPGTIIRNGKAIVRNFREIITLVGKTLADIAQPNSSNSEANQKCLSARDVKQCMRGVEKTSEDSGKVIGVEKRQNGSPYPPDEQQLICTALETFVEVHILLLSTIIGKSGLLTRVPVVGVPLAAVLRSLEAAVDELALNIIGLIPGCAEDVQPGIDSLKAKLSEAVKTYNPFG